MRCRACHSSPKSTCASTGLATGRGGARRGVATAGRVARAYLQDNTIGDAGAAALAAALPESPRLNDLRLGGNQIGDDGATALANALGRFPNLSSGLHGLRLSGNRIGDAGGIALATALRAEGTGLTRLELATNRLGDGAAAALGAALAQSQKLLAVDVDGNAWGATAEGALAVTVLRSDPPPSLLSLEGVRLAQHVAAAGLDHALRDCDNAAILAALRAGAPARRSKLRAAEVGAQDTHRVNSQFAPRDHAGGGVGADGLMGTGAVHEHRSRSGSPSKFGPGGFMLLRTPASEFDDEVDGGSPTRETPAAGGGRLRQRRRSSIVGVGAWVDGLWLAGARPGGPGNGAWVGGRWVPGGGPTAARRPLR